MSITGAVAVFKNSAPMIESNGLFCHGSQRQPCRTWSTPDSLSYVWVRFGVALAARSLTTTSSFRRKF